MSGLFVPVSKLIGNVVTGNKPSEAEQAETKEA